MQDVTLLVVDACHYMMRAQITSPARHGPAGRPTAALHALARLLRTLQVASPGAHLRICAFEGPSCIPGYMPTAARDAAVAQTGPARELARILGWTVVETATTGTLGLIAWLAQQSEREGVAMLVASCRKRVAMFVSPHVAWREPLTGALLGPDEVLARFGVAADRVADYVLLAGDADDGLPALPGCGPKRARNLLAQYANMTKLASKPDELAAADLAAGEHADLVPYLPLLAERAAQAAGWCVPEAHGLRWPLAPSPPPNAVALAAFAGRHGPMDEAIATPTPCPALVSTEAALSAVLAPLHGVPVAIACAPTSGAPRDLRLRRLALAWGPGEHALVELDGDAAADPQCLARLAEWLADPGAPKVAFDARSAHHLLDSQGLALHGVLDDPYVLAYVLHGDPDPEFASLVRTHLPGDHGPRAAHDAPGGHADAAEARAALALHADLALQLAMAMAPLVDAQPGTRAVYRDIELPLVPVLAGMERHGVLVDRAFLARLAREQVQQMALHETTAAELAGHRFDLAEPGAAARYLATGTGDGRAPPDERRLLETHAPGSPLAAAVLAYRHLKMLRDRYSIPLQKHVRDDTGRVHTVLGHGRTGRLTSGEPSLHNLPVRTEEGNRVRRAIVAPPGHVIVSADYAQIELRILAHLSGDTALCAAFAAGLDVHRVTAAELLGVAAEEVTPAQRRFGKRFNFAMLYGARPRTLAEDGMVAIGEAGAYVERYFARFPGVHAYLESTRAFARRHGYVETLFGRRIPVPEVRARRYGARAAAERQAINATMQGTAADLVKLAMLALSRWIDEEALATRLVLQVHDELVLETPVAELGALEAALPALMQLGSPLRVPLVVQLRAAANWAEAK